MEQKLYNTIIIGGGQAGLSVSYFLKKKRIDHIILEKADKPAYSWREQKWDSFCFVIPNWTINLPGGRYDEMSLNADEFILREDLIQYFESYIVKYQLPINYSSEVTELRFDGNYWYLKTQVSSYQCKNVFIATGFFQKPNFPKFSQNINPLIMQLHSSQYKNPSQLKEGNVLIIGSGQSGMQIAEEIHNTGVRTFLSIGSTPWIPRNYLGKDIIWWLNEIDFFDRLVSTLEDPREKFSSNPQISGGNGGHDLNLHEFAEKGIELFGHASDANNFTIRFASDLHELLSKNSQKVNQIIQRIDELVEKTPSKYQDLQPPNVLSELRNGFDIQIRDELNLQDSNITNIIWANGYLRDYSFIKSNSPITDSFGFPIQDRGVSSNSGLYFIGMPWIHTQKSGLLWGVGDDAEYMVSHLIQNNL